jgi:hypothetical protein
MGRWAQRHRRGSDKGSVAIGAHITRVDRNPADASFVRVTFDTQVLIADSGSGDLQINEGGSPEDAAIDTLISTFVVQYGSYDPVGVGQAWTLVDAAGLHFAGGVALLGPLSGIVLS